MSLERPVHLSAAETGPENLPGLDRLSKAEQRTYQAFVTDYRGAAINPRDFDQYDVKRVKEDLDYVTTREAEFRRRDSHSPELAVEYRRGELAEMLIWNGIEHNGWLGPDAEAIVASRYDDIKNGVDQIAEIDSDNGLSHLALSIDVTVSAASIEEKLNRIREEIWNEELGTIDYFQSEAAHFTGQKKNVPRVVLEMDDRELRELSALESQRLHLQEMVRENKESVGSEGYIKELRTVRERLASHPFQAFLTRQIIEQLKVFTLFAEQNKKTLAAQEYARALRVVEVQEEKQREALGDDYPVQGESGGRSYSFSSAFRKGLQRFA